MTTPSCHERAAAIAKTNLVVSIAGLPWICEGKLLKPMAMPHLIKPVQEAEVRRTMAKTKALAARWTDDWDTPPCEWWSVVCDNPQYKIDVIESCNRRHSIRKGIKRNEIRRLEPDWFSANGYDVYAAAAAQYGKAFRVLSGEEFRQNVLQHAALPGRQSWGAFFEGKLVAYVSCDVFDDAANMSWGKSDPQYLRHRPNDAIYYEIARHYLVDEKLRYVTAGERTLEHPTHVQDMLLTMGFRRVFSPLRASLHPIINLVVRSRVDRWGQCLGLGRLAPAAMERIKAAAKFMKIAQACLVPSTPQTAAGQSPGIDTET